MAEPKHLLIVDDDGVSRGIISHCLKEEDYILDFASNGKIALEKLESNYLKYDVVLLDLIMPIVGGMEVLKRMKEHPLLNKVPVIIQSSKVSKNDIAAGFEAGAYFYLTKPLNKETLLAIIKSAVFNSDFQKSHRERALRIETGFSLMNKAQFTFQTIGQVYDLSTFLSYLCPDPEKAIVGLTALMVNAIEHGHFGISDDVKGNLMSQAKWEEEIDRLYELPENKNKIATLIFERSENSFSFTIEDEGDGFDWESYLDFNPDRAYENYGRGIALARIRSFDSVEYLGNGNKVRATINTESESIDFSFHEI